MSKTIIIDPGHGGFDPGAIYENRKEKADNLRLALAVGQELQNAGYQIIYTRTDDRYDSPYDKAQIANSAGGDLFLSFHRNFAETPDLYQGVQALVYDKNPLALRVAKNVNENLEEIGFKNLGIESRKELVVLRRTSMPAVLLEVGFINSKEDNRLFDENFDAIARAIADGVMAALPLRTTHAPTASTEQVPPIPQTTSDASQTTSGKTNQMSAMRNMLLWRQPLHLWKRHDPSHRKPVRPIRWLTCAGNLPMRPVNHCPCRKKNQCLVCGIMCRLVFSAIRRMQST